MEDAPLWYRMPAAEVLQRLGSSAEKGLTEDEAAGRLRQYGLNELQRAHHVSAWEVFAAQFKNLLIVILLIAVGLSAILGHAIEARIYAEDPDHRFMPSPGPVTHLRAAAGPGIRDDSGLIAPGEVPIYYDPLVSKLTAWGPDRAIARARLARALHEYEVEGIRTTLPFFRWLLTQEDYVAGAVDTTWLDRVLDAREGEPFRTIDEDTAELAALAAAIHACAHEQAAHANHSASTVTTPLASGWLTAARREALQ